MRATPVSQRRYKMTLWLSAAEYWALMHASAALGNGKISFTKWFKKQAQIEQDKAVLQRHAHELEILSRGWGRPKRGLRTAAAYSNVKRNSPRKLAA